MNNRRQSINSQQRLKKVVNSSYTTKSNFRTMTSAKASTPASTFLKPRNMNNAANKISYFKLPFNSEPAKLKKFVTASNCKSKVDLHKKIEVVSKKAISKKTKKFKKSSNTRECPIWKNPLSNTIKTTSSGGSLAKKTPNSVRNLDKGNKFKIAKNKIITMHENKKLGLKTTKASSKKTRNLYNEIKNAVTENLTKKENPFTAKRNSLTNLHSSGGRISKFEYAESIASVVGRNSTVNLLASVPDTTRTRQEKFDYDTSGQKNVHTMKLLSNAMSPNNITQSKNINGFAQFKATGSKWSKN